jgi:uncharacterized protein (UPF0335 family)
MAPPGTNSTDAQGYLKRIETLLFEIARIQDECAGECKEYRDDIKTIYTEAKDHGVDVPSLKAAVKWRAIERRQQQIGKELGETERAMFERLIEEMGDLGRAAAERAGYREDQQSINA